MPTYCYENEKGEIKEKVYPIGLAPKIINVNGVDFKRSFQAENVGTPPTKGWPIECLGSGVNAAQRQELGDFLKKKGVPTEISEDGNPIYRDANHRKKALKVRNFVDKASYI